MRRILVLLVSLAAPQIVGGACRQRDRAALRALYENLGGANWTWNTHWPSGDPCLMSQRLFGVGCTDPCRRYHDMGLQVMPRQRMITPPLRLTRFLSPQCTEGRVSALYLSENGVVSCPRRFQRS